MPEVPSVDDAEKGLASLSLTTSLATLVPPPPVHGSGHIDASSEKVSTETKSLDTITAHSTPKVQQPPAKLARRKTSRWIRFQLWFNTYRYVVQSPDLLRKAHLSYFMLTESFLR